MADKFLQWIECCILHILKHCNACSLYAMKSINAFSSMDLLLLEVLKMVFLSVQASKHNIYILTLTPINYNYNACIILVLHHFPLKTSCK
jgi:hypothetical protein